MHRRSGSRRGRRRSPISVVSTSAAPRPRSAPSARRRSEGLVGDAAATAGGRAAEHRAPAIAAAPNDASRIAGELLPARAARSTASSVAGADREARRVARFGERLGLVAAASSMLRRRRRDVGGHADRLGHRRRDLAHHLVHRLGRPPRARSRSARPSRRLGQCPSWPPRASAACPGCSTNMFSPSMPCDERDPHGDARELEAPSTRWWAPRGRRRRRTVPGGPTSVPSTSAQAAGGQLAGARRRRARSSASTSSRSVRSDRLGRRPPRAAPPRSCTCTARWRRWRAGEHAVGRRSPGQQADAVLGRHAEADHVAGLAAPARRRSSARPRRPRRARSISMSLERPASRSSVGGAAALAREVRRSRSGCGATVSIERQGRHSAITPVDSCDPDLERQQHRQLGRRRDLRELRVHLRVAEARSRRRRAPTTRWTARPAAA